MFGKVMFIKIVVAIFVLSRGVYSDEDISFSHDHKKQNKFTVPTNKKSGEWQVETIKLKHHVLDKILSKKTNNYPTLNNITTNNEDKSTKKNLYNKTSNSHHVILLHQNANQDPVPHVRFQSNVQPSTPSYIEFHYFDNQENANTDQTKNQDYKIAFLRSPLFLVRLNAAVCNTPSENAIISSTNILSNTVKYSRDKHIKFTNSITPLHDQDTKYRPYTLFTPSSKTNNDTCAYKTSSKINKEEKRNIIYEGKNNTGNRRRKFESTTAYDRIKFFEIYDSDTYPPRSLPFNQIDYFQSNYYRNKSGVNLNKDDTNIHTSKTHYVTRYVKKYSISNQTHSEVFKYFEEYGLTPSAKIYNQNQVPTSTNFPYLSQSASWSEFPFVAVYTYEPAQVHCDCASISSHWLVSSATCLYLHHKDLRTEGRSAYVSYCSNNWRHPGRIAYVRRSHIHPRFKPNDKTRRLLYNIGVIQVANSMSNTCNGWQPISLMSHQFAAGPDGALATAVGWGLDRYDTRYTTSELPLHSLMLYQSLVFSDSCPGNSGYSNAKLLNEESVKNVYCLSLPPYIKEENDTVHGGLLLVEGKLIALYLQEERRPWGLQSAQYTSIWRLIPWLLDVAQEIDERDSLDAEI